MDCNDCTYKIACNLLPMHIRAGFLIQSDKYEDCYNINKLTINPAIKSLTYGGPK